MDPDLDLTIERVIRAPRDAVWEAWTTAYEFQKWWLPRPYICRVDHFLPHAGGGFVTTMSQDGAAFTPHMDAAFLVMEDRERLVFTNAVDSDLRPTTPMPAPVTGEVILTDHPDGTRYTITARHGDAEARARHDELGLVEGWTRVTAQLAELVES